MRLLRFCIYIYFPSACPYIPPASPVQPDNVYQRTQEPASARCALLLSDLELALSLVSSYMYITTGGQFITQDMTLGEIQIPSLPEIRNLECAYTTVSQAPQCVTVMCNNQEAAEPA